MAMCMQAAVPLVEAMVDTHVVQPLEMGLSDDMDIAVDTKSLVKEASPPIDGIACQAQNPMSWWTNIMDIPARNVSVYKCNEGISQEMCTELCLLKCPSRCCTNWTVYNKTGSVNSHDTVCSRSHQSSLYSTTLKQFGTDVTSSTGWDIDFITCESVNSSCKQSIHLNYLECVVDTDNVLFVNPNNFPITLVLEEKNRARKDATGKNRSRKRGRKSTRTLNGVCQVSVDMDPGSVMCFTSGTVLHWNIFTISNLVPNYILCVLGRYNMNNWVVEMLIDGHKGDRFTTKDSLEAFN